MALPTVTQQELIAKRTEENAWDIVMLHHAECTACVEWEQMVEGIVSKYPNVTFSRLDITASDMPLFAPPVIPAILALHNGTRIWECLGNMATTEKLEFMIDEWLQFKVNFDSISGVNGIHEFS